VGSTSVNSEENKIRKDHSSDSVVNNDNSEEDYNYYNNTQQRCDNKAIEDNSDNVSLWGSKQFQHVTLSHDHIRSLPTLETSSSSCEDSTQNIAEHLVLDQIFDTIKLANGSQIAVNSAIQSACSKNEEIRAYLGDKLTSRENRKVRYLCLLIIRHPNIEVIKHKPQLIVRWSSSSSSSPQTQPPSHDQPLTSHEHNIDEGATVQ
jgi:hypothetical protein